MPTDQDFARVSRLADERLAGLDIPVADRPSARRTMVAAIQKEDRDALAAEIAKSEATAERARIAAIVDRGRDLGKARQALRLALSGPVTPEQAAAILPTMRGDLDVPDAGTLPSTLPTFGSSAEQAERKRITAIFTAPASVERFNAACSFGLLGDAPVAAVIAMLAQLEVEFAPQRLLSIAERAAGMTEAGGDPYGGQFGMTKQAKTSAMWSKAVRAANESIGVKIAEQPSQPDTTIPAPPEEELPDWAKEARQ